MMKRTLLLGGLILLLTVWRLEPSAQGGLEWNHWDIGESQDYATGKSALAVALDIIESSGWEVRFMSARPGGGYAVVGRGPKGLHVPQPVVVPQNSYDYGSGSGSGTVIGNGGRVPGRIGPVASCQQERTEGDREQDRRLNVTDEPERRVHRCRALVDGDVLRDSRSG